MNIDIYIHIFIYGKHKRKTEARRFSSILLTLARRSNRSYLLANGLNGLNGLAHLYIYPIIQNTVNVFVTVGSAYPLLQLCTM